MEAVRHHAEVPRGSSAGLLRDAPGEYGGYNRPPRLQLVVVVFLIAWAGGIGLYAAAYGAWAAVWNLKRSPPSFVGAVASVAIALACPITAAIAWRVGKRRHRPRWHVVTNSALITAGSATAVIMFLVFAALMATGF
jgi:hypothetical protein